MAGEKSENYEKSYRVSQIVVRSNGAGRRIDEMKNAYPDKEMQGAQNIAHMLTQCQRLDWLV